MKTIFIYYSFQGHTKNIAQKLKERYPSVKLLEIKEDKKSKEGIISKFFWLGKQFLVNPTLAEYIFEPSKYEMVIVGTPVWANTLPPALKKFIEKEKENLIHKEFVFVANHGGGPGKIIERLSSALGDPKVIISVLFDQRKAFLKKTGEEIETFLIELSPLIS
jgi:menaquinone-dependent protoporphyrinogen IX oxidase